jgi:hypothetical protein
MIEHYKLYGIADAVSKAEEKEKGERRKEKGESVDMLAALGFELEFANAFEVRPREELTNVITGRW